MPAGICSETEAASTIALMNVSVTTCFPNIRASSPFGVFRFFVTTCDVFPCSYSAEYFMSSCSNWPWSVDHGSARSSLAVKEKLRSTGNHVILHGKLAYGTHKVCHVVVT